MKLFFLTFFVLASIAHAKLNVVATTADIAALAKIVGGDVINVSQIAKGSQDPHFIEAKPSYMVKIRDADLVIANGLSLEIGWLPTLLKGARNPKVIQGSSGYLELGTLISPLDKPTGNVSRAMGDIHPEGNPHFTLDPLRISELSQKLAEKFSELDSTNKEKFLSNAKNFQETTSKKMVDWTTRIQKTDVKKVVTFHPSMNYFLDRFGLKAATYLEPKPGVPPSAQHILSVIETMKSQNIKLILVDSFFDTKIADRIAKEVSNVKVITVGISVESKTGLNTLEDVTEQIVKAIESTK